MGSREKPRREFLGGGVRVGQKQDVAGRLTPGQQLKK